MTTIGRTTFAVENFVGSGLVMTNRQGWADLYAFEVERIGGMPLFRQIYAQMRSAILQRTLRPGTKLPSTRELARRLGVSRNAVVAAYEQLLAEGYASGRIGAGTYITGDFPEPFAGAPRRKKSLPASKAPAPARPIGHGPRRDKAR